MKTILLLLFCLATTSLNAQIVNIPDPEFKYILVNYESFFDDVIDTNFDDEIQYSEAAAFTGTLDVGDPWLFNGDIQDLTGIEAFVNITELICLNNQLTSLDLSQNTALKVLNCAYNQLVSFNISQCSALEELTCSHNQLTTLNVSQNIALQYLDCGDNQLTSLDMTQNTNLNILYCNSNQLATLDLTHNINLEEFSGFENELNILDIRNANNTDIIYFSSVYNPNLSCIFVDDAAYSGNATGWYIDSNSSYVETQQQCDDLAAVEDFSAEEIKIYPNPVKNVLHIETSIYPLQIAVYNIHGGKILQTSTKNKHQINFSPLKSGIYFIQLSNDKNQSITKKIIKL